MKNKAVTIGLIALILLAFIAGFCLWAGKKISEKLTGTDVTVERAEKPPETGKPPPPRGQPANPQEAQAIYLALGNPSNATPSASSADNYLMINNFYAVSYNRSKAAPNWVAWRVTKADMSNLAREDNFRPDDRLPKSWERIKPSDYTGSGYDRGHVCPNADRDGSPDSMASTFLMTNMVPQTPDLNRGPWAKLEGYLRTLVTRGSDVYIYAGVYGEKGKIRKKITIPENNWKIAVAVPAGGGIEAINENTRVIAVDMPNVKGIKNADWQIYRTTVSDLERKTGYDFFSNLPRDLQDKLENKNDNIDN
jgi:endonuclease G